MVKKVLAIALSALMLINMFTFLTGAKDDSISEDFIYGDVNGNGKVDFFDSVYLFFASLGFVKLSETQNLAADVNGDGKVDRADRKLITQYNFRSVSTFPVEKSSWGEGTPIETKYDENGVPEVMLFRSLRGKKIADLDLTISGIIITEGSDITVDYELGIHQTDFYVDLTARQFDTFKFKTDIVNIRTVEKDLDFNVVVPPLFVYINLMDESGLTDEQKETWRREVAMFMEYKDYLMETLTDAFSPSFTSSFYKGSSIVQVGNAKYLCETYEDVRCYFTADGALRRVEPTNISGEQISIMVFSEKEEVNMQKFNIPAIYRKVTIAELMEMLSKIG